MRMKRATRCDGSAPIRSPTGTSQRLAHCGLPSLLPHGLRSMTRHHLPNVLALDEFDKRGGSALAELTRRLDDWTAI